MNESQARVYKLYDFRHTSTEMYHMHAPHQGLLVNFMFFCDALLRVILKELVTLKQLSIYNSDHTSHCTNMECTET